MIEISYLQLVLIISILWILVRGICFLKNRQFNLKRELILLLVYICILVVVRYTFCPFERVDGKILPLRFFRKKLFPLWVNFVPFVKMFDYSSAKKALLNLIGNVTMFIPLGIVWPSVFKQLNKHWKVIAAGMGVSLSIELLQLPFFERATDIDDLILNTAGFLIGYGIWLLVKKRIKQA